MCVQLILFRNQNNSTLFWRFTLLKLLHMWTVFIFIHTKKKSLSTERLLICPRDETGSLYITRVFGTVRCFCMPSTTVCQIVIARISVMPNLWAWRRSFFVHNYKSMKFKSMKWWSYLARRLCVDSVFELFPSH